IPATSLKGTFDDEWNERARVKRKQAGGTEEEVEVIQRSADGKWLFGETEAENAAAGALQFSEARLLAFPIRSAKGSFAWITCPLMLQRAVRDGVLPKTAVPASEPSDEHALFARTVKRGDKDESGPLGLDVTKDRQPLKQVVLEEYTFTNAGELPTGLGSALQELLNEDEVWKEVASRLVILSNGMMSFFS